MTIRVRTERAPTNADGKLKVAQLPFVPTGDAATLKAEAKKLGFQEVAPDQFVHKDGSWAKLDESGRLQRGVRQTQFVGIPQPYVAPPKVDRSARADASRPTLGNKTWAWFQRNTALGKTPIISDATSGRATLTQLGYALSSNQGGKEQWVHPDGSWFRLDASSYYASVTCGWKGYELGELPFQR